MKYPVSCVEVNGGQIKLVFKDLHSVFKEGTVCLPRHEYIGSFFFVFDLVADIVVDLFPVYGSGIAGQTDLFFDGTVNLINSNPP